MVPSLHTLWNVAHTQECNTILQQCNHLICNLCGTRYVTGYLLKWHRTMEHSTNRLELIRPTTLLYCVKYIDTTSSPGCRGKTGSKGCGRGGETLRAAVIVGTMSLADDAEPAYLQNCCTAFTWSSSWKAPLPTSFCTHTHTQLPACYYILGAQRIGCKHGVSMPGNTSLGKCTVLIRIFETNVGAELHTSMTASTNI